MSSKVHFENLFKEQNSKVKKNDSDFVKLKKEFSKIRNKLGETHFKEVINNHISNS